MHEKITFHPRINVICGKNAQGKTSLLEAIYLLSTGRSFRTNNLSEIISYGEDFFYIKATIEKNDSLEEIKLYYSEKEKKLWINSKCYFSFSHLLGLLPSSLCAPQDRSIISGTPQERRRFFNLHLAQSDPLYVHHLKRFYKSLKQRNFLLKHPQNGSFEIWEEQMAISGKYLNIKRKEMLKEMKEDLQYFISNLSDEKEKMHVRYIPSFSSNMNNQDTYIKLLQNMREKEKRLGFTTIGPHRDDFLCLINKKCARTYASEGQKRTAIMALKLAEWKRLCHLINDTALILIDDFSLHLDKERKSLMQNSLQRLGQIFFTTPDPKDEWKKIKDAVIFEVKNRSITSLATAL